LDGFKIKYLAIEFYEFVTINFML